MRVVTEFADDLLSELRRLDSEWSQLQDVWKDDRAEAFENEIIEPYRAQIRALESAIREMGEHLDSTGEIQ